MARYTGRHRDVPITTAVPTKRQVPPCEARPSHSGARRTRRPLVALGTAVGVTVGVLSLTASVSAGQNDAVGRSVDLVSHTEVLARAVVTETSTREQQRVSRGVTRVALSSTAKQQAKAAKAAKAAEAEAAEAAAAKKAQAAAAARAKEAVAEKNRRSVIADAQADPRTAARALMSDHGWSDDTQFGCLVNLWNGESDWTWSAQNAGSGAYGIPQSLPASKMARFGNDYRTNPITQMKWGLWYIESSYGSPCNAWSIWQSRSPHWY